MQRDLLTLTALRKKLGITQEELASALGRTAQPDVSTWESGSRIPSEKAQAIIDLFYSKGINRRITADDLSRPWDEVILTLRGTAVPA